MHDELLRAMQQSVIDGAPTTAAQLAHEAIAKQLDLLHVITHGYASGISFAGEQYGCGAMFLPDLLACAEAMKAAMSVLEPELRKQGTHRETLGRVVLGTAKGDIHDIGKNLVATILAANGFEVFDIGTSASPEAFIHKVREVDAQIIGVSALLTTTMAGQKSVIEALDREGLALVQMVTPVTPAERLAMLCREAKGFVYAVTMTGTTGTPKGATEVPPDVLEYMDRVKRCSNVPVCAGFGIRSREQVARFAGHVDGVVVGSALVEVLERGEDVRAFLRSLREPP